MEPQRASNPLIMGAVAYDQKVVPIWDGFQQYFRARGLEFDYVLYSNYERQVEAHLVERRSILTKTRQNHVAELIGGQLEIWSPQNANRNYRVSISRAAALGRARRRAVRLARKVRRVFSGQQ